MNFQRPVHLNLEVLFKELKMQREHTNYYAFPATFGNSAGPRRAMGLSAMTIFTIDCWECEVSGVCIYFCAGMYAVVFDKHRPEINVHKLEWKYLEVVIQCD